MKNKAKETSVTQKMLFEAVEVIMEGMDKLGANIKSEFNHRFDDLDYRLTKIEAELKWIKNEINDLKAELAFTASLKRVRNLEKRVETLEKKLAKYSHQ